VALPGGVEILGESSAADVQETADMAGRSYAGTAAAAPPAEFDGQSGAWAADSRGPRVPTGPLGAPSRTPWTPSDGESDIGTAPWHWCLDLWLDCN
jgi:hypothetical protein